MFLAPRPQAGLVETYLLAGLVGHLVVSSEGLG